MSIIEAATIVAVLIVFGVSCNDRGSRARSESSGAPMAASATPSQRTEALDAELTERLRKLCGDAGGDVGLAVVHVETGRTIEIEGGKALPLYSVFKVPLAIAVLKDVEEKRLALEQKEKVGPEDVAPGSRFNTDLWQKPVETTVAELLEFSIVRSDNTSSDKLMQLIGGPAAVTKRMRDLGFSNINIQYTVREFSARRDKPNTGSAVDLARLLAKLQKGEVLEAPHTELLLGFMTRALIGEHRLRGDLPAGTPVADKTGTGDAGSNTNDIGLITLPEGKGHLAMAVLISGSKSSAAAQEKLIAKLARAAYDSYVSGPASGD
jgi:beta-lactamase class A